MHVSSNKEIAPEWITNQEIILGDLTPEGRALYEAVKAAPTIRIRLRLTERELIVKDWNDRCGKALRERVPLQQELDKFVKIFGADKLDSHRTGTYLWGGLRWTNHDRRESPEEYLNRVAAEIAAIGEIAR